MSIPAGPYYPTTPLVAAAWIGQRVPGVVPSQVATTLPRNLSLWAAEGFVQVTTISGRTDIDVGTRMPLVQVDAWAVTVDAAGNASDKPPRGKAARLAALVHRATENDLQAFGGLVTLPADYLPARVLSVFPRSEPVEVTDDPAGFARFTFDLELDWVRA